MKYYASKTKLEKSVGPYIMTENRIKNYSKLRRVNNRDMLQIYRQKDLRSKIPVTDSKLDLINFFLLALAKRKRARKGVVVKRERGDR